MNNADMTVMVVDDVPANLDILSDLLESQGYRVTAFPHGDAALRAAAHKPPDLILLDILMPHMDGFEVCRQLKEDPKLKDIPVIFISGLTDVVDIVRAFSQGGVDYIAKPFRRAEVLARVKTHLHLLLAQKELQQHRFHLEKLVWEKTADLEIERRRLQTALDAARACTWEWNVQTDAVRFNDRWARTLGYELEELEPTTEKTWEDRVHPKDLPQALDSLGRHLRGELDRYEAEYRIRHRDGHWVWLRSLGRVMEWTSTAVPLVVAGIDINITEQKAHQQQLEFLAYHDALTGLPNRNLLTQLLNQEIMACCRSGESIAVIYIDLDDFAVINDEHGQTTGDRLLVELARRLTESVSGHHHCGRMGGDEFAVVLCGLKQADGFRNSIQLLSDALSRPFEMDGVGISVTAGMGVAQFPQPLKVDAEQLLRQAHQAMYQAKVAGKNRFHFFDPDSDRNTRTRFVRLEEVAAALAAREFVLYYQPKVNMRSGAILGFEALIRWRHPERGLLPPALFIPLLAQHPLAIRVGEWVIQAALDQLARWSAAGLTTSVSVNVDCSQLHHPHFADWLEQQLPAHPGVAPHQLELEILESGAITDMARVSALITRLEGVGVTFALDDFGTGFSSMTFLKHLKAHTVKIDQSFVRTMLADVEQALIIESILSLARNLGRHALAEGVETELHGSLLLELGCELGQGYAVSRPMPADDVPQWAANWNLPPSWQNAPPFAQEGLPVVFVELAHRAVFNALQAYLQGEREAPPQLDSRGHRMGRRLHEAATAGQCHNRPSFDHLITLHDRFHELAGELVERCRSGRHDHAKASQPALEHLNEAILAELGFLRRSGSNAKPVR